MSTAQKFDFIEKKSLQEIDLIKCNNLISYKLYFIFCDTAQFSFLEIIFLFNF